MIVEKIDDNEHTMRRSRLCGEIGMVLDIIETLSGDGIYLCHEEEETRDLAVGDRTITVRSAHLSPIRDIEQAVYRAFDIDPAALAREEEYRRRRHVAIHGREP